MRWLAIVAAGIAFICGAAALLFVALSWVAPLPETWGLRGSFVLIGAAYAAVGAFVATRRPESPIGWLLLATGVFFSIDDLAAEYAVFAVVGRDTILPAGELAAWVGSWLWTLPVALLAPALLVLFPNGVVPIRGLSRWWWPAIAVSTLLVAAVMAFRPGPLQLASFLDNPFPLLPDSVVPVVDAVSIALAVVSYGAVVAAMAVRFRRARNVEREQLKWLAAAIVPYGVTGILSAVLPDKSWQIAYIVMQVFVPVAVGIAILRYRLYDIDVLINRALVYGALSGSLVLVYIAWVVAFQTLLRPFTAGSEVSVAASTLATIALFQPLRRRLGDFIDRRFYRRRYEAGRVLDAFSSRLRGEVEIDAVRELLLETIGRTVQPVHAEVWLRREERGR